MSILNYEGISHEKVKFCTGRVGADLCSGL